MPEVETRPWPTVRPDGRHGGDRKCFYCDRPVGQPHGEECVHVLQRVEYDVRVAGDAYDDLTGEVVGMFERTDPIHWTEHDCEFHKNGSSWCAGNALDDIRWADTEAARAVRDRIEKQGEHDCCCSLLAFSFGRVTDPGPINGQAEEQQGDE